ncbi:hypothetical protein PPERSA_04577 [Pseudocohnilembus persalinus]|uniref:RRM domain-containing protein n=1 Tax=Pseudocohnilembus persalinus TaxID=266149 RepID=A0A0V0QEE4_PSEPJ|nr:hypothetical protein PPERSA_04577 [Pseudocohnilembus persalinus]|eukprot:KRX00556.1 hypothetical protein PPERSA_04577 [Pseudocohnilembus persalinus]
MHNNQQYQQGNMNQNQNQNQNPNQNPNQNLNQSSRGGINQQQQPFQNNFRGNMMKAGGQSFQQNNNPKQFQKFQGGFPANNQDDMHFDHNNISHNLKNEHVGQAGEIEPHLQFNYRHARRLYIGNIPELINQEYLTEWLYRSMEACGGLLEDGNPIQKMNIDSKSKYAFVELRSIEETSALVQLDGLILWNRALRIRRPTEYDKFPKVIGTRPVPQLDISLLEGIGIVIIPTQVEDSTNKIFLANLPNNLDEFTILENLKLREHGELKAFHLVKDNNTNESKGYAFLEYKDPSVTDLVIKSLNECQFCNRTLTCKRAIGDGPQNKGSGRGLQGNKGIKKQFGGQGRKFGGNQQQQNNNFGQDLQQNEDQNYNQNQNQIQNQQQQQQQFNSQSEQNQSQQSFQDQQQQQQQQPAQEV